MPMSLSHKSVKKYNKKLPANVTKNKILDFFGNQGTSSKIGKKARKCGFVKRKGSFQPTKFAQAVITGVGSSDTPESLSKICELYNVNFEGKMQIKPFWNRMSSDECVDFFEYILEQSERTHNDVSQKCAYAEGEELIQLFQKKGLPIEDIYLYDGSYWKLKSELADVYQGTRSQTKIKVCEGIFDEAGDVCFDEVKDAGIGLQTKMSMKTGAIKTVVLTAETANEKSFVEVPGKDDSKALMLMDSGYFSLNLLKDIDTNGSFYITKGRKNCAAVISDCRTWGTYRKIAPKAEEYNGMKVSDALIMIRQNKQNIDFTATFKTGLSVRMVAFYSKEKNETVLLVTNINHEIFAPKLVTNAYRVRWQCELCFKNLKSGSGLRFSKCTTNLNILRVLIMSSLCAYFLKNIAANFLSRMLKNISFWKIHVKPSWFNDFVKAFFNCNLEKLHDILKTLKSRSTFVTKSRQSFKKELEHRTLNSVLQSIRESLMEPIIKGENLIA